jgi:hypothetical protein
LLGIAKLLLQVVDVKGETLQVVSLIMTGWKRDWGRDFHSAALFPQIYFSAYSTFHAATGEALQPGFECNRDISTVEDARLIE